MYPVTFQWAKLSLEEQGERRAVNASLLQINMSALQVSQNRSQGFISSLLLNPQKAHGESRLCQELVGIQLSPEPNRERTGKNFLHITWDHHLNCTR